MQSVNSLGRALRGLVSFLQQSVGKLFPFPLRELFRIIGRLLGFRGPSARVEVSPVAAVEASATVEHNGPTTEAAIENESTTAIDSDVEDDDPITMYISDIAFTYQTVTFTVGMPNQWHVIGEAHVEQGR